MHPKLMRGNVEKRLAPSVDRLGVLLGGVSMGQLKRTCESLIEAWLLPRLIRP